MSAPLESRENTNRARRARRVVLVVAAVLALVELGLRGLGYGRSRITVGHPELGWVHLPDQDVIDAGDVASHINDHGYRDEDWGDPPGADPVLRVAVVGDSVAYGLRVAAADRWPDQLEARVAGADVMNFAVPGYGVEQMARTVELRALAWEPDVVVIGFNDAAIRPMLPVGRVRLPLERLWLSTALLDLWRRDVRGFGGEGQGAPRSVAEAGVRADVEAIVAQGFGAAASPYWDLACERLLELRASLNSRGVEVVLLLSPNHRHFEAPDAQRGATHLADWLLRHDWCVADPHGRFLEAMGGREALAAALGDQRGEAPRFPGEAMFLEEDSQHLTPRGHALLADSVHAALAERGWLPTD